MKRLFAIALLLSTAGAVHAQSSGEVRIYRCTDAAGKQTLRDTPCPKGQQQQTRDMLRPKDAPVKPAPPPSPKAAPVPVAETTRTVYLAPPRPMYECTTFEGKRYTSDNGDGNPRWQPYWTLGYPVYGGRPRGNASRGGFRPAPSMAASIGRPQSQAPVQSPPVPSHRPMPWPVAAGGGWVRDDCTMLPPREACARLRDRRSEIRTRFFNAMPSERDVLRVEERTINARLDNDCGGH